MPVGLKLSIDISQVPIQAAYLYDAVMIYARALTEIFENNEDPRNGSAIMKRIANRSYRSIQGYDVRKNNFVFVKTMCVPSLSAVHIILRICNRFIDLRQDTFRTGMAARRHFGF